jgi:very-short-patch-repair endonuclease
MACAAKQRAKSNKSKGEQLIEDIFIHHLSQKHKFIEQFMINVYMDNKSIPHHQYIDFYVPDFNLFIEYDGIQHFQEQKFFDHSLSWQRQHDHHKDAYAKKHHIKMLRIPYTLSRKEVEKRVFNALSH